MAKGVHRVAAGTKSARQMMARAKVSAGWGVGLTTEQRSWNAQIEAKRKAKEKK